MKYLPLYYKWMRRGRLPGYSGLCLALQKEGYDYGQGLEDFMPLHMEDVNSGYFFADKGKCEFGVFNATRQNVILFLAAMNNEL